MGCGSYTANPKIFIICIFITLTGYQGSYSPRMYNFKLTSVSSDAEIEPGHELIDFSCVRCVKD